MSHPYHRLQSMLQDAGETCLDLLAGFNDGELHYRDDNYARWDRLSDRLSDLIDEMVRLQAISGPDDSIRPESPEYTGPEYRPPQWPRLGF